MPQRMKIFVKCTFFCHRPLPPPCRRLACAATVRAATDTLCKPPVSWLPTPQTSPHSSPSQKPPSLSGPALLSPLLRSVLSARRLRPGCCCWWTERAARRQGRCFSAAPLSFAAPSSPSLLCCPLLSFDNHLASKSWNHVCCWPPNAQYSMWLFMQVRCIKQSTASGIICFHPLPAQLCCTLCCLHFPIKLQLPSCCSSPSLLLLLSTTGTYTQRLLLLESCINAATIIDQKIFRLLLTCFEYAAASQSCARDDTIHVETSPCCSSCSRKNPSPVWLYNTKYH